MAETSHLLWTDVMLQAEYRGGQVSWVRVVSAPQRALISDELLEKPDTRWLVEGDGIITFCPSDESRVSYRRVEYDLVTAMWVIERIS